MLGYANWSLNAFPILKPALNSSYDKISGKIALSQGVYVNKSVQEDLLWFASSFSRLDGVQLFEAEEWIAKEADLEVWSDASKDSLGFWVLKHSSGFFGEPVIHDSNSFNVFLNEAIAILAAIHWSASLSPPPRCLALHTDSSNSFNIFNSLRTSDPYNSMLMSATSIRCRQDNSLLWDLPTESSFMGQIISSGLHHFRLFFLHTKLGKDISGTGNLDFQERSKPHRRWLLKSGLFW